MSQAYAMEDDQDVDINDPRLASEDLSGETSDVLPKATNVLSTIKSLKLRTQLEKNKEPEGEDNKWIAIWMSIGLQLVEGIEIDGEPKYAGRFVYDDICVKVNKDDFPKKAESTFYSRAIYTQLLRALGYDLKTPPANTKEWRDEMLGREVRHDIFVKAVQERTGETDADGKPLYADNGDFKNTVKNFRSA